MGAASRQRSVRAPAGRDHLTQFRRPVAVSTPIRPVQPSGNHWGPAVALLKTASGSPFYFNFHDGDLGNTFICGPSGSGKTVVLNFLLAQAREARRQHVFFDKDRGAEIFVRACGGTYLTLKQRRARPAARR